MKDLLIKLCRTLSKMPKWAQVCSSIFIAALVALSVLFSVSSCSSFARVAMKAPQAGSTMTVTIHQETSPNVDVSPNTNIQIPDDYEVKKAWRSYAILRKIKADKDR